MESDLNRNDVARKSFRIPAHRLGNRLVTPPVPPPRVDLEPKTSPHTASVEEKKNERNLKGTGQPPPPPKRISNFQRELQKMSLERAESSSIAKASALQKTDKSEKNTDIMDGAQPSSTDVLNQLEKHIIQMEIDSKNKVNAAPVIKPMLKVSNRYGHHENLLNTGISNIASGTALGYQMGTDDHNDGNEAESRGGDLIRDSVYRKSTGAGAGDNLELTKLTKKSKIIKPVNRTVSDTKNLENTVKSFRQGIKKPDIIMTTTTTSETAPLQPLNIRKKEDVYELKSSDDSSGNRSTVVQVTPKRQPVEDVLRQNLHQRLNRARTKEIVKEVTKSFLQWNHTFP